MSNESRLIDIQSIKKGRRIRRDLGDLSALEASMRKHGMLNPIVLAGDLTLIAGERRLATATRLGWSRVPCHIISTDDELVRLEIEIDENATRKEFSSDEMADAINRLERLQRPSWIRRLSLWFRALISRITKWRRRRERHEHEDLGL